MTEATQTQGQAEQPLQLLDFETAAAVLGVGVTTIKRLVRGGAIPAINVSTGQRPTYRVSRASLEAFVAERTARS